MKLGRRELTRLALAAAALQGLPPALPAAAMPWPSQPIRLLVVYPPGGVSDVIARALAELLSRSLGVPVLVEYRAGAGGSVGLEVLARAAPDGHTIAFSAISPLTMHGLLAHGPEDPLHRVVPVAGVVRTPVLVAGTRSLVERSFDDMIARARTRPGAVRWASSGMATVGHMVLVQVRLASQATIIHVPYQGGGAQLNDALSGQFEVLSTNLAALQLQYVNAGSLAALAVGAPQRLVALPDVPTLAELGYPQANLVSLFGIFAPAHTPAGVVHRLNAEINRALQNRTLREQLRGANNIPASGSPEDFASEIVADRQRNERLIAGSRAWIE
jgi:tripartite-type tricarboxylate transporter receptor subunit TctC